MNAPWPPATGQSVTASVVFGDVIQISGVGGDVSITAYRPPYRLEDFPLTAMPLTPEEARAQPSRLLLPRYGVVPFAGRDAEIGQLCDWLGGPNGISACLVHGSGGQGKTRLAATVAARAAGAGWALWRAVQLPSATVNKVDLTGHTGVVVIVDYADRWANSDLLGLIANLRAINLRTGVAVRVLLLARSSGYWWFALADHIERDLFVANSVITLGPLGDDIDRRALFDSAAAHFASCLTEDKTAAHLDRPDLTAPAYASILSVHMAALVAVVGGDLPAAHATDQSLLSADLLRREYARWYTLFSRDESPNKTSPAVMGRTVFVATLTGAVSRRHAYQALERVKLATTAAAADVIIDEHRSSYPPTDPGLALEPMQPDRVGEDYVALTTPGHTVPGMWPPDDWTLTAPSALTVDDDHVIDALSASSMTVLVETARRWPHVADSILYPLIRQKPHLALVGGDATLSRLAGISGIGADVLEAVDSVLPLEGNIDYDAAAAEISSALTPHRLAATTDPGAHALQYANLGYRLYKAGRYEAAASAAAESVRIRRDLTANEDDVEQQGDLARSLYNLGAVQINLGRWDEARAATEDSSVILRPIADSDPDRFLPDLALSLTNLAETWAQTGHLTTAIGVAEEAVATHRRAPRPAGFAVSLSNLGRHYSTVGRHDEGLALAREALAVIKPAVVEDPAANIHFLVGRARTLATCLSLAGLHREALETTQTTIALMDNLRDSHTTPYLESMGGLLDELAAKQAAFGRASEAADSAARATAIHRELAERDPTVFIPILANSLSHLGAYLVEQQQFANALPHLQEAETFCRRLAAGRAPLGAQKDLGRTLINLANCYAGLNRLNDMLAVASESVSMFQRIMEVDAAGSLLSYPQALNNLADCYHRLGRHNDAQAVGEEAVSRFREAAASDPDRYRLFLARSLSQMGVRYYRRGKYDEALACYEEAHEILFALAAFDPDPYLPDIGRSLNNLSATYWYLERYDDALAFSQYAVAVRRSLVERNGSSELPKLASALSNFATFCSLAGHCPDALEAAREAVQIFRDEPGDISGHFPHFATALESFTSVCLRCGSISPEALAAAEQSVRLFAELASGSPAIYQDSLETARGTLAEIKQAINEHPAG